MQLRDFVRRNDLFTTLHGIESCSWNEATLLKATEIARKRRYWSLCLHVGWYCGWHYLTTLLTTGGLAQIRTSRRLITLDAALKGFSQSLGNIEPIDSRTLCR
jgi:hypothetical protein